MGLQSYRTEKEKEIKLLILFFLFIPVVLLAATATVTFDSPINPSKLTVVLVSDTSGAYSQGQQSKVGAGHVVMDINAYIPQFLVAYRYNPETKEQSEYSNEIEYVPAVTPGTLLWAQWEYPEIDIIGFRFYIEEDMIAEVEGSEKRTIEFVCILYGDNPVNITITAYDSINESLKSEPFFITPVLPARNVFQLLPWGARNNLCQAVRPSGKACWLCH